MKNNIKYLCIRCRSVRPSETEPKFSDNSTDPSVIENVETIKEWNGKQYKKLRCGHFILSSTPGFQNTDSENLDEHETAAIRRFMDSTIMGKKAKEFEEVILRHCEEYQTLLKLSSKQRMQAKYAIHYLDQLRERYSSTLSNSEKENFETKFAHFLDLKPTTSKVVQREKKETKSTADKQKEALKAMIDMLKKTGYKPEDIF